jgi:DNA helicase-2/ATP-dependent DNA helicase PcrA
LFVTPGWDIVLGVDHLSGLNDVQKEAVLATEGPLLVLAGAGAGKTRVITHRILQIVKQGVAPEHVLAITFTNKAAAEMRERVHKLLGEGAHPYVSTFHSLGLLLIKENFRLLGLKRKPSIYDRADSTRVIKDAIKTLNIEGEMEPKPALGTISKQKGEGVVAGEYAEGARTHRERLIANIWLKYEKALADDNALDFDDLLLKAERLLKNNEELRKRYQERWKYIHIDEYQDTNRIQAKLAEHLIGPARNVCAVGDIDQTIYGWRGAEIANILSFEKKFPGAKIVLLEENYRSTKNIIAAANDVIAKNLNRIEKNSFTKNADGELLSLFQAYDETDEAGYVARTIASLLKNGCKPKDFCVLYRANFQSRAIEEALLGSDIVHQVLGTRFFERKEVKDTLSFIRAAVEGGAVDFARIANVPPRGIGKVTLLKVLGGQEEQLTGAVRDKVVNLRLLLMKIQQASLQLPPSQLVRFVITESGLERMHKEDKIEGAERLENLRELATLAARYDHLPIGEGLEAFMESAALASDQDELKETTDAVRLMTVHAAKGLEFLHVFIVGLEDGLFPYERDEGTEADKEEERRLMYVALTRAQKKVFLSYASYRTIFGSKNATLPSQFLSDIPQELLEWTAPERLGRTIYLD